MTTVVANLYEFEDNNSHRDHHNQEYLINFELVKCCNFPLEYNTERYELARSLALNWDQKRRDMMSLACRSLN